MIQIFTNKNLPAPSALGFCLALLWLISPNLFAASLTRGPYLQMATPHSIVVRWRTDMAEDSVLHFGNDPTTLSNQIQGVSITTEHELQVTNLQPATRYYYAMGSTTNTLADGTNYFFITPPILGTRQPVRIWAVGDAGTANSSQRAVRDAYFSFTESKPTDLWLLLGDNAYQNGTDSQYQAGIFNVYADLLRRSVLWPTLGNHDTDQAISFTGNYPYFNIFTLPTHGEAGGVPSGTEHFYSFENANIHFICLDSMTADRSTNGTMANWLRADLAATTNDWIIAFWHHPPYSKGSHDSDAETELIQMRSNIVPILEQGGVDLVLCGHSHAYERSYLLDGHYGASSSLHPSMKVNPGSGRELNSKPYYKYSGGPMSHSGTVYIVAGNGGKIEGGALNHPAMFTSSNVLGSVVVDVDGDRMDVRFLRQTGVIGDWFTIMKTNFPPPVIDDIYPTLKIISPAANTSFTNSNLTLQGTCSDNYAVSQILLSVNNSTFAPVSSFVTATNRWSETITLTPGTNFIQAFAVDFQGHPSSTNAVKVFFNSSSLLTLSINGLGKVTSASGGTLGNPTNGAKLLIGRGYSLTAAETNKPFWILSNWTCSINDSATFPLQTNALRLNFIMQTNLAINANFITNPLMQYQGIYNGLVFDNNSPNRQIRHQTAGYVALKASSNFGLSGKIYLDGNVVSFSGKFAIDGSFTRELSRVKFGKADLTLNLRVDFSGQNMVTGSLNEGTNWTSRILADRAVWTTNAEGQALAFTNAYTMVIPGFVDNSAGPMGYGWAVLTVDHLGRVKMAGQLSDGQIYK